MKHIKHLLASMISVIFNHVCYSGQSRKDKHGFWNDIRDHAIYFERRGNPYRPLD